MTIPILSHLTDFQAQLLVFNRSQSLVVNLGQREVVRAYHYKPRIERGCQGLQI